MTRFLYFYHNDHLGGVNVITDFAHNGARVQLIEYLPWGGMSRQEGSVDPTHGFTGQELDPESGLYYYGARYYDADLGRFISPDSMVPEALNPQSLNRYSYVLNNPANRIDPTGHCSFLIIDCIIEFAVVVWATVEPAVASFLSVEIIAGTAEGAAGFTIGDALGWVLGLGAAAGLTSQGGIIGLFGGARASPYATVGRPITQPSLALQIGTGPPEGCRPGDDYCNNEILNQLAACVLPSACADLLGRLEGRGKRPSGVILAAGPIPRNLEQPCSTNPTNPCNGFPSSPPPERQGDPSDALNVDPGKKLLEELYPNNKCPSGVTDCNKMGTLYKNGKPVRFRNDPLTPKGSQERLHTVEEFLENKDD